MELKTHLQKNPKIKDLGHLTSFLGLEISLSKNGFHINQQKYAEELLSSTRLTDTELFDTPLELKVKLSKDAGSPLSDPSLFRRLVGTLIYLTMTRPDISHAVHTVGQFLSAPHKPHLTMVYRSKQLS